MFVRMLGGHTVTGFRRAKAAGSFAKASYEKTDDFLAFGRGGRVYI